MKFNKKGIILALQHLKELRQGEYMEQRLSYLERPLATGSSGTHAPFENPCLFIGEIESRLKKCSYPGNRDGFLTKVHYAMDESVESLAREFGLPEAEVERGIRTVLKYVSYKWPKDQSYREYKKRKRH